MNRPIVHAAVPPRCHSVQVKFAFCSNANCECVVSGLGNTLLRCGFRLLPIANLWFQSFADADICTH